MGRHEEPFNFYPRSPCGERQIQNAGASLNILISIHALLAESDVSPIDVPQYHILFLSTLSLRRATVVSVQIGGDVRHFYPRSPCGERPPPYNLMIHHAKISIHALLAESDMLSMAVILILRVFLSTLSLRRATVDR